MTTLPTGVKLVRIRCSPNDNYMAGSDGAIYSRTKYMGFGRKTHVPWYQMKARVPVGKRYPTVTLCHQNKKITKSVHRLICEAFNGPPPSGSHQVRHLDGNRGNSHPSNLMWGTQEENWQDRRLHGRVALGENHHAAKFTNEERSHIRWAVKMGLCSQRLASRVLSVGQASISAICAAEI